MATVNLTLETFDTTLNDNDIVLLDFWAEWCGPCKRFAPVFEAMSEKYPDIVFGKVDTESQQELAAIFQIRSIPMLMVFREKIPVFAQPGALPAQALDSIIEQVQGLDMEDVRKQYEEAIAQHEAGNA